MITKQELVEYAKRTSLNIGQAEKDYFQNIILFIIYQAHGKDIVFKGGTALKKCYGIDRFSEDLDFTCSNKINVKPLEDGLKRFKIEYGIKTKEYENGLKVTLQIKGPLYIGIGPSLCNFIIDFSFRENVVLEPEIKTIGRFLEETPAFDVVVMQEKEILAEKIRAISSRTKARDVYDLWFLLKKGVEFDRELVIQKLDYYGQKWSIKEFEDKLDAKKSQWETELEPLLSSVPDFKKVRKEILERLK